MPYICKDCSNKEIFNRTVYGTCNFTESQSLNQNNEIQDNETDYDEYNEDSDNGLECSECGGSDIEEVDDEEWEKWEGPITTWRKKYET